MLWTAFFPPLLTIIAPFYNIFFFFFQSLIDESLVEIMDNCLKRQIFWKFIVKGDTNLFLYPRKPPAQTIRGFIAVIVRRLVFDWSQEERKKNYKSCFILVLKKNKKIILFRNRGSFENIILIGVERTPLPRIPAPSLPPLSPLIVFKNSFAKYG
jgi:hypothetical protein